MKDKGKLRSAASISEKDLNDIYMEIKLQADASSRNIYVYPYLPKTSPVFRESVKVPTSTTKTRSTGKSKGYSLTKRSRVFLQKGNKRYWQSRHGDTPYLWAVRVEGNAKPIRKSFQTKSEAKVYARKLLAQGKGLNVVAED